MSLDQPSIRKDGERYRLVYTEVYATDPDDLWEALTTPERLARWMAVYTGDLRLGGTWEVASDGDGPWGRGTVTACDAPHGFTTTWQAEQEDPTELVVCLEPVDAGTRLVLEHDGVRSIFYGAGWQTYLEQLIVHIDDPAAPARTEEDWQRRFGELRDDYTERFSRL
jgi:uncharacterized protein YndB with AHSA1/START domain